jgi:hypothetical protein
MVGDPIGSFSEGLSRAVFAVASCGKDVIVFSSVDRQLFQQLINLLSTTCSVRYVELERECLVSGVKTSKDIPYLTSKDCLYIEIAQGTYVGLLPGFIDAQCLVCRDEVSCRLFLQKRAYTRGRVVRVESHIDSRQVKELIEKLRNVGDSLWCVDSEGSLIEIVQL